jgi:hypothetical protein
MRNGKTSLVSCTGIILFVKQSIKFRSYLLFLRKSKKVTKHSFIMMHIIFSTFNIVFCNFPLRSSSWWLNLFFLFFFCSAFSTSLFDCTFSHILTLPLWIERLPFFECEYCISYTMAHPDGRFVCLLFILFI